MRILAFALLLAAAAPAAAQELGARTRSPAAMVAELGQLSPEDEMRALALAADRHPLGTVENPVRVGGPEGERAYLARLRCADGEAPRIGGRSDAGTGAFGSVVAAYQVSCAGQAGRIVFDMYHAEHVESRAPAGFSHRP